MRITFVLPMFLATPAGGFKIVYEYANRLQARGHQVSVVHPRNIKPQAGLIEKLKSWLWPLKLRLSHRPLIGWFSLSGAVQAFLVPDLCADNLPEADVIIATAYETAFAVNEAGTSKGKKYYLIQSFEDWDDSIERARASWQLPLQKIVISQWLYDLACELGEADATNYVPNGLNFSEFYLTRAIAERQQPCVAMMVHPLAFKGTSDGLAALKIARTRTPNLQAMLFGTEPRTPDIPNWCEYVQLPSTNQLREIYNDASVFLHPSTNEGWGLPALEAMACGCALIAADNRGIRDFVVTDKNAFVVPVKRPDLLAEKLHEVLTNHDLRVRLAREAQHSAQRFTWERAAVSFEKVLTNDVIAPIRPPTLPAVSV